MSNLSAFLSTIAACEGSDYDTLYGGGTFDSYADHPRKVISAGGLHSTAAGRYQILAGTWDDFCKAKGPHDFSPASQDECATWLLERCGALDPVNAGDLETAITCANKTWASLPGSPYGQPIRTLQFCLDAYTKAGGVLGDRADAPAPIEDKSTEAPVADDSSGIEPFLSGALKVGEVALTAINPFAGLAIGLASKLIEAFSPLAKEKLSGLLQQHGADAATAQGVSQAIISAAKTVTGIGDDIGAVAAAQADPALASKTEAQALQNVADYLDRVGPWLDKAQQWEQSAWAAEESSRNAASARQKADGQSLDGLGKAIVGCAVGAVLFLLLFVCAIAGVQVWRSGDPSAMVWAAVTGFIGFATGVFLTIVTYRFGTSRSSASKDAVIGAVMTAQSAK